MLLEGVRRQLSEAQSALAESARLAEEGSFDPAYRTALRARNLLFHATRGVAAARGEPLPEMPAVGVAGGGLPHHADVQAAIRAALAVQDDLAMAPHLAAAHRPTALFLGWLRAEVGKLLGGH